MKNIDRLKEFGQEHLLKYYDELTNEEKKSLEDQINAADFTLLDALKNKDQHKSPYRRTGSQAVQSSSNSFGHTQPYLFFISRTASTTALA